MGMPAFKRRLLAGAAATALGLAASGAQAVYLELETGIGANDTTATREATAETVIEGRLDAGAGGFDPTSAQIVPFTGQTLFSEEISAFNVDATTVPRPGGGSFGAGDPFLAVIDNAPAGPGALGPAPDTILGVFDAAFPGGEPPLFTDDDSSPIGNGLGSALGGRVGSDGSVHLAVTGYDDFDFNGYHDESGGFDLFVQLGIDSVCGDGAGGTACDVDFYQVDGLTPGQFYTAHVAGTNDSGFELDTVLGQFDASGNLIAADDDGGGGLSSRIAGVVPASGSLVFAVSGYDDLSGAGFVGDHTQVGDYTLGIDLAPNDPANPLLPGNCDGVIVPCDGPFAFDLVVVEGEIVFTDPIVAVGYDFSMTTAGVFFDTVVLPDVGDGLYEILVGGASIGTFAAGGPHSLPAGTDAFTVLGIEPGAGLDPGDPNAFVTGLSFTGPGLAGGAGTAAWVMLPITADVAEPATLGSLGLGIALLGLLGAGRRRRRV